MRELDGVNRKPWERQRSLSGRSQAGMFSLAFHEFRGSSEPTNLILARANMPDPPRRIFLAMGCFFPHEIATKETFSVLSSFACSLLYLLSLNVFGFFIFYFPTISLSSSIVSSDFLSSYRLNRVVCFLWTFHFVSSTYLLLLLCSFHHASPSLTVLLYFSTFPFTPLYTLPLFSSLQFTNVSIVAPSLVF